MKPWLRAIRRHPERLVADWRRGVAHLLRRQDAPLHVQMVVVSLPGDLVVRVNASVYNPIDKWSALAQKYQEQATVLSMSGVSRLWHDSASIRVLVLATDQVAAFSHAVESPVLRSLSQLHETDPTDAQELVLFGADPLTATDLDAIFACLPALQLVEGVCLLPDRICWPSQLAEVKAETATMSGLASLPYGLRHLQVSSMIPEDALCPRRAALKQIAASLRSVDLDFGSMPLSSNDLRGLHSLISTASRLRQLVLSNAMAEELVAAFGGAC